MTDSLRGGQESRTLFDMIEPIVYQAMSAPSGNTLRCLRKLILP